MLAMQANIISTYYAPSPILLHEVAHLNFKKILLIEHGGAGL